MPDVEFQARLQDLSSMIRGATSDPALADVVVRRVAGAAADGLISRSELKRILDVIAQGRRNGTIKRPGAYFVTCAKQLFERGDVPWSTA